MLESLVLNVYSNTKLRAELIRVRLKKIQEDITNLIRTLKLTKINNNLTNLITIHSSIIIKLDPAMDLRMQHNSHQQGITLNILILILNITEITELFFLNEILSLFDL